MPPPVLGFKHSPVPRRARRMVSTEHTSTRTLGTGVATSAEPWPYTSMSAIHGVAVTRRASFLLGFAPDDAPLHMQLLLVVLPPPGVLRLNDVGVPLPDDEHLYMATLSTSVRLDVNTLFDSDMPYLRPSMRPSSDNTRIHGATLSGRSEMYGRRRLLSTSSSDEEGGLIMTRLDLNEDVIPPTVFGPDFVCITYFCCSSLATWYNVY
ncbi:hypothetical protein BDZ89DRAFT_1165340 [Hymenopellis radicata]|nr:hypothetical protein BDZ89DRAFT_1165340 [Hymenopellis radicata]